MKRLMIVFTGLLVVLLTAACTANLSTGTGNGTATSTGGTQGTGSNLPDAALLIVGTLKLDGTEMAVTKEQAQDLLFLWQGYKELSTRDSAAPEEKSAILAQAKGKMTETQMSAIKAMNLTPRDVMEMVQSLGSTSTASSSAGSGNEDRPSMSFSAVPGGGGPGGGPGGGVMIQMSADGGGMPPDAVRVPAVDSSEEASTERQATAMAAMADTLLDPLISMLEKVLAL
jgi:hypothetical protein